MGGGRGDVVHGARVGGGGGEFQIRFFSCTEKSTKGALSPN